MTDTFARMVQIAGNAADWQTSGTILRQGELGLEINGPQAKLALGDGVSALDQLPYILFGTGGIDPLVRAELNLRALQATQVIAGSFLVGGGPLTADVTLSVDSGSNGWGRRYVDTAAPPAGVGSDGDIWYTI